MMAFFRTASIGLAVATIAAASRSMASGPPSSDLVAQVDAALETALSERHLPGLSVAILRGDEIVLARGLGFTQVGRPERVHAGTVFQLGSISKQFLAALVLALAEDGRLSLDDGVATHLPEFVLLPPTLRIRHLLNHTSGLRELFLEAEARQAFDDLTRTRADLDAFLRQLPVEAPPGSRWSYSNTNYAVLALLAERITGTVYEHALAERFFRPLGLASIRHCTSVPAGRDDAYGHERQDGTIVRAPPENMEWARGDGGLCGTAGDVARWVRLLATGRIVSPRGYEEMTAPTRLVAGWEADYGFGLSLVPLEGRRKVAHNGAMRGFSASAAYYPDSQVTIVVLANRGDVRTESLERQIARVLLGMHPPAWSSRDLPRDEQHRMAGTYDIGVFAVRVVVRDDRLWIEMPPPGPTTALRYLGDGEFAGEVDPDAFRVRFDPGAPGGELRLYMGAMHWYGRRVPDVEQRCIMRPYETHSAHVNCLWRARLRVGLERGVQPRSAVVG